MADVLDSVRGVTVGDKIGRWTITRFPDRVAAEAVCDCGVARRVQISSLKAGDTTSCGCAKAERHEGKRFGHWLVLARIEGKTWKCRCDCGTERGVSIDSLKSGDSTSCGCARVPGNYRHGYARGQRHAPEHTSWSGMIQRCTNPKRADYADYGGRGIKVCARWMTFENFIADMGPKPSRLHSLDRFPDTNGNYEPRNCRWATPSAQAQNRRTSRMIEYEGKTKALIEWARHLGVTQTRLARAIKKHSTVDAAFASVTPP